jgi:hypothetical protein
MPVTMHAIVGQRKMCSRLSAKRERIDNLLSEA